MVKYNFSDFILGGWLLCLLVNTLLKQVLNQCVRLIYYTFFQYKNWISFWKSKWERGRRSHFRSVNLSINLSHVRFIEYIYMKWKVCINPCLWGVERYWINVDETADLKTSSIGLSNRWSILAVFNLLFFHIERICACLFVSVCVFYVVLEGTRHGQEYGTLMLLGGGSTSFEMLYFFIHIDKPWDG